MGRKERNSPEMEARLNRDTLPLSILSHGAEQSRINPSREGFHSRNSGSEMPIFQMSSLFSRKKKGEARRYDIRTMQKSLSDGLDFTFPRSPAEIHAGLYGLRSNSEILY
jgi:hypothetical protein